MLLNKETLNGTTTLLFFFYKDGFGIKSPMKVDMLLNKETSSTRMALALNKETLNVTTTLLCFFYKDGFGIK